MIETVLFEDLWGKIVENSDDGVLEIRWHDSTADMAASEFNAWLAEFANFVEATGRTLALIDATNFRLPPACMDGGWRDEHITPRYNAMGMQRFAFVMPSGTPRIGEPPAREGPASFPTAYFEDRADAVAWLREPAG